jgi:hypothetical protein
MGIYPIHQKHCNKCNTTKSIENFYKDKNTKDGYKYQCKSCSKEYVLANHSKRKETCKLYYKTNKDNSKLYYQSNKNKIAEYKKEHYIANKDKIAEYKKEHYIANKDKIKQYRLANTDMYNKQRSLRHKERMLTDTLYQIRKRIRVLIKSSITRNGYKKTSITYEILGCSYDEFKTHIEKQFLEGMTWSTNGEWHIDHIIPIAFAQSEHEIIMLNHYTNLRPLWAIDNIIKSDTITEDSLNHPLYDKLIQSRITR